MIIMFSGLGQPEHIKNISTASLPNLRRHNPVIHTTTRCNRQILDPIQLIGHGKTTCRGIQYLLPKDIASFCIKGAKTARVVRDKRQTTASC